MPWGYAAGAIGSAVVNSASKDKNGGAGTQTTSKEPWSAAAPWLESEIKRGQGLEAYYDRVPFNDRQRAALDNSYALSDYSRALTPSLLGQIQAQPVGFDKNNRTARPKAWDWALTAGDDGAGGGLGQRSVANPAAQTLPALAQAEENPFVNQSMNYSALQQSMVDQGRNPFMFGGGDSATQLIGATPNGGYGSWKFGDQPKPGTKAYRDMSEYFLMGGNDPDNRYGKGMAMSGLALMGNSGNSVGGSPGADGSGGGSPGGNW